MKRILIAFMKNIPAMLGGLIIAFAILEISVRIFFPQERQLFMADDRIRTIHKPNVTTTRERPEFTANIHTNAQGFMGADFTVQKPAGTTRIAAIGDSFTEGVYVGTDKVFPALLEKDLNSTGSGSYQVYNFGMSGTGTAIQSLIYKYYADSYHPDMVILQYYLGNDASDDLLLQSDPSANRPFEVTGGKLRSFLSNTFQSPRFIIRRLEQIRIIRDLFTRSGLSARRADFYNAPDKYPFTLDVYNTKEDTVFKDAFTSNCTTLASLSSEITQKNIPILVVVIPDKVSLYADEWKKYTDLYPSMNSEHWDLLRPMTKLEQCLDEHSIPYVNMYPIFKAAVESGSPKMYYQDDVHLNPAGNVLVADALKEAVLKLLHPR